MTVALTVSIPVAFADTSQAELIREAKITKEQASKKALTKVPNGTIKRTVLEKENNRIVWSFNINILGTKNIYKVNVDAKTGEIVEHKIAVKTNEK